MAEELTSYGVSAIVVFFIGTFVGLIAAYYTQVRKYY